MFPKQDNWRCKKYTDAAKGQACVRCGAKDGTVVPCHYTGLRQHTYGKGHRIKCTDVATADLCSTCHVYFDQPTERKSVERSEEFLHCILLTVIRRLAAGILTV
jgi:hypothetical protein